MIFVFESVYNFPQKEIRMNPTKNLRERGRGSEYGHVHAILHYAREKAIN